jgi:predicted  nucleic acid-binding Zn-ribbon protein
MPIGTSTASSAKQLQRALKYSYLLAKLPQSSLGGASRRAAAITLASKFNRAAGAFLGPRGGRRGLQRGGGEADELVKRHAVHIQDLGAIAKKLGELAVAASSASAAVDMGKQLDDYFKEIKADEVSFAAAIAYYFLDDSKDAADATSKGLKKRDSVSDRVSAADIINIFAAMGDGSKVDGTRADMWHEYFKVAYHNAADMPTYDELKDDRNELIAETVKLATPASIATVSRDLRATKKKLSDVDTELAAVKADLTTALGSKVSNIKKADGSVLAKAEYAALAKAIGKMVQNATLDPPDVAAFAIVHKGPKGGPVTPADIDALIKKTLTHPTDRTVVGQPELDILVATITALEAEKATLEVEKKALEADVAKHSKELTDMTAKRDELQATLDNLKSATPDTSDPAYAAIIEPLQTEIATLKGDAGAKLSLNELNKAIDDAFGAASNTALTQFQGIAVALGIGAEGDSAGTALATSDKLDEIRVAIENKISKLEKASSSAPPGLNAAEVADLRTKIATQDAEIAALKAAVAAAGGSGSSGSSGGSIDSTEQGLIDDRDAATRIYNSTPSKLGPAKNAAKAKMDAAQKALDNYRASKSMGGGAARQSPLARLNSAVRALTGGATTLRRTF